MLIPDRRQIGRALMVFILLLNAGLFAWIQLDRVAMGEQEQRLVLLQSQVIAPGSPRNPVVLKRELAQAEEEVVAASVAFPTKVDPIAVQDHVLTVAGRDKVELTSLNLQPVGARTLAGANYPVLTFTVQARGDLLSLYNFLSHVERNIYSTTVLENVRIAEVREDWSLQYDIVVFGRPQ